MSAAKAIANDDRLAEWPAIMSPRTLAKYLDCSDTAALSNLLRKWRERGFPAKDQPTGRYYRADVDAFLETYYRGQLSPKKKILEAAGG